MARITPPGTQDVRLEGIKSPENANDAANRQYVVDQTQLSLKASVANNLTDTNLDADWNYRSNAGNYSDKYDFYFDTSASDTHSIYFNQNGVDIGLISRSQILEISNTSGGETTTATYHIVRQNFNIGGSVHKLQVVVAKEPAVGDDIIQDIYDTTPDNYTGLDFAVTGKRWANYQGINNIEFLHHNGTESGTLNYDADSSGAVGTGNFAVRSGTSGVRALVFHSADLDEDFLLGKTRWIRITYGSFDSYYEILNSHQNTGHSTDWTFYVNQQEINSDDGAIEGLLTSTIDITVTVRFSRTEPSGEITVQNEGTSLTDAATTLNFTGSGVTASGTGSTKTINISGGGGADFVYERDASDITDLTTRGLALVRSYTDGTYSISGEYSGLILYLQGTSLGGYNLTFTGNVTADDYLFNAPSVTSIIVDNENYIVQLDNTTQPTRSFLIENNFTVFSYPASQVTVLDGTLNATQIDGSDDVEVYVDGPRLITNNSLSLSNATDVLAYDPDSLSTGDILVWAGGDDDEWVAQEWPGDNSLDTLLDSTLAEISDDGVATTWTSVSDGLDPSAENEFLVVAINNPISAYSLRFRTQDIDVSTLSTATLIELTHTVSNVTQDGAFRVTQASYAGGNDEFYDVFISPERMTGSQLAIENLVGADIDSDVTNVSIFTDSKELSFSVTDLSDTPSSLGTSGQILAVNSAGTALEFVDDNEATDSEIDARVARYIDVESAGDSGYTAPNASGTDGVAAGPSAIASGTNAVALGINTDASENDATAIAPGAQATHQYSTAIGYQAATDSVHEIRLGRASDKITINSAGAGQETALNQLVSKQYVDAAIANQSHYIPTDKANTLEAINSESSTDDLQGTNYQIVNAQSITVDAVRYSSGSGTNDVHFIGAFTRDVEALTGGVATNIFTGTIGDSWTEQTTLVSDAQDPDDGTSNIPCVTWQYDTDGDSGTIYVETFDLQPNIGWTRVDGEAAVSGRPPGFTVRGQVVKIPSGATSIVGNADTVILSESNVISREITSSHTIDSDNPLFFRADGGSGNDSLPVMTFPETAVQNITLTRGDIIAVRYVVTFNREFEASAGSGGDPYFTIRDPHNNTAAITSRPPLAVNIEHADYTVTLSSNNGDLTWNDEDSSDPAVLIFDSSEGRIPVNVLGSGSPSSSNFLRGDGAWTSVNGGSDYLDVNSDGTAASATGTDAIAIGENALADNTDAITIGRGADSGGSNSVAIGRDTSAVVNSTALGVNAAAAGDSSVSIGVNSDTTATGDQGIAIGDTAQVSGEEGIAIGHDAAASGSRGIALGQASSATFPDALALGSNADAVNTGSIALGVNATTTDARQLMIGGTTSPNQITSIVSPGFTGGSGEFIAVDANGNWSTSVPAGGGASIADFDSSSAYSNNDIVTFSSALYQANTAITAPAAWAAATSYTTGDYVIFSSTIYIALNDITGAASNTNPAVDTTNWSVSTDLNPDESSDWDDLTRSTIDSLSDVSAASPTSGQILYWNGVNERYELEDLHNNTDVFAYNSSLEFNASNQLSVHLPSNSGLQIDSTGLSLNADLDDLGDVTIGTLANAQILRYSTSDSLWRNTTLRWGDLNNSSVDDDPLSVNTGDFIFWNGSSYTNGSRAISDLSNVSSTTPANGNQLIFNSSNSTWTPGALTTEALADISSTTATDGQILVYDTGLSPDQYVPTDFTLANLADTLITSPADGTVLTYNSANSRWVPGTTTSTYIDVNSSGTAANASGADAIAIGEVATAAGLEAVAIGESASAAGSRSIALGTNATTTSGSSRGIAIGDFASAGANNAIAIGGGPSATDRTSVGANSTNSIAIGDDVQVGDSATNSLAIGTNLSIADDCDNSFIIGQSGSLTSTQDNTGLLAVDTAYINTVASDNQIVTAGSVASYRNVIYTGNAFLTINAESTNITLGTGNTNQRIHIAEETRPNGTIVINADGYFDVSAGGDVGINNRFDFNIATNVTASIDGTSTSNVNLSDILVGSDAGVAPIGQFTIYEGGGLTAGAGHAQGVVYRASDDRLFFYTVNVLSGTSFTWENERVYFNLSYIR